MWVTTYYKWDLHHHKINWSTLEVRKWLCKKEKRKEKEIFSFSFFDIWIDKEVRNDTFQFSYFRPLPWNQTAPKDFLTLGTKLKDLYIFFPSIFTYMNPVGSIINNNLQNFVGVVLRSCRLFSYPCHGDLNTKSQFEDWLIIYSISWTLRLHEMRWDAKGCQKKKAKVSCLFQTAKHYPCHHWVASNVWDHKLLGPHFSLHLWKRLLLLVSNKQFFFSLFLFSFQ